ncbi:hypothetical protein HU200_012781 [Digitaria exilis]|uniref:Leucine-rich repeat-containing N-terminal plant-type domain-containing protein n=1 Tax=Digitaria exilis TaxID=1010633 RepID=A0A835FDK1_9POAL|nr:hypothetical protein HU200_012781 [Digitaria exilis]
MQLTPPGELADERSHANTRGELAPPLPTGARTAELRPRLQGAASYAQPRHHACSTRASPCVLRLWPWEALPLTTRELCPMPQGASPWPPSELCPCYGGAPPMAADEQPSAPPAMEGAAGTTSAYAHRQPAAMSCAESSPMPATVTQNEFEHRFHLVYNTLLCNRFIHAVHKQSNSHPQTPFDEATLSKGFPSARDSAAGPVRFAGTSHGWAGTGWFWQADGRLAAINKHPNKGGCLPITAPACTPISAQLLVVCYRRLPGTTPSVGSTPPASIVAFCQNGLISPWLPTLPESLDADAPTPAPETSSCRAWATESSYCSALLVEQDQSTQLQGTSLKKLEEDRKLKLEEISVAPSSRQNTIYRAKKENSREENRGGRGCVGPRPMCGGIFPPVAPSSHQNTVYRAKKENLQKSQTGIVQTIWLPLLWPRQGLLLPFPCSPRLDSLPSSLYSNCSPCPIKAPSTPTLPFPPPAPHRWCSAWPSSSAATHGTVNTTRSRPLSWTDYSLAAIKLGVGELSAAAAEAPPCGVVFLQCSAASAMSGEPQFARAIIEDPHSMLSDWTDADGNACDWHSVICSAPQGSVVSLPPAQALDPPLLAGAGRRDASGVGSGCPPRVRTSRTGIRGLLRLPLVVAAKFFRVLRQHIKRRLRSFMLPHVETSAYAELYAAFPGGEW